MRLKAIDDAKFAWLMDEIPAPPDAPALPVGGLAPQAVLSLIRGLAVSVGSVLGGDVAWLMIVDGEAVGLISLTKVGDPSRPEIGYGVAPSRQRRGHARSAVAALIELVVDRFAGLVAETAVYNAASQGSLARNGFSVCGKRTDAEDGPVLCWAINFDR
ncbi:MAG: GNAT family protein [Sphingomicrobium sp.]